MRKTMMSAAILGVVGLLVVPGLGCGKQEAKEVVNEMDEALGETGAAINAGNEAVAEAAGEEPEWESMKQEDKAAKIDEVANEALQTLFTENSKTKELYARSYGWAVFDKLALDLFGGGNGVAVVKETGEHTYMKMGIAGVSIDLDVKKFQVVFFMQDSKTFNSFVEKGWQADAGGGAVAGKAGAEVMTNFVNGLAVYQLTEKGLMANADIVGTKYWKNNKLNN